MVEWQPSKLLVAGSIPVSRSSFVYPAACAPAREWARVAARQITDGRWLRWPGLGWNRDGKCG